MRIFLIVLSLFFASCNNNSNTQKTPTTAVTVSIGSQPATGAIGTTGDIPLRVQSIKITALNATGQTIAGPVIANRPMLASTIQIPNGLNIRIQVLAYDAPNATGTVIYETLSKAINLTGIPVTLPVIMSLSVAIRANTTTVFRQGTVNLTGTVSGNTPPPTSPLVWTKSSGTFTVTDAYGAVRTWQAPNILGKFFIAAHVDPNKNPDQDPLVIASAQINVINRDPYIDTFNSTFIDTYAGTAVQVPLIIAGDLDADILSASTQGGLPTWVSLISTGTNPLNVGLDLTPPLGTNGLFTFKVGVTDGFGGNISKDITIKVNAIPPAPVVGVFSPLTYSSTVDIYGYALVGSTVDLYANGTTFISQVTPTNFSEFAVTPNMGDFYFSAIAIPNGTHTITAYARLGNNISVVSNTVSVTVNQLLGSSFVSSAPLSVVGLTSIDTAFVNQDAFIDMVVGDIDGGVYIYKGNGTVTAFTTTPTSVLSTGALGMNQFAIGDINGDTYTDIVLPSDIYSGVAILTGNGFGGFSQPLLLNIDSYAAPSSVAIADMNNDGYADIITANNGSILGAGTGNTVSTLNGGSQGFTLGTPFTITGNIGLTSISTSDFNLDGYTDAAIAGTSISVVQNNPLIAPTITNYTAASPIHVTTGYLNSDSYTDIVSCNNDGSITVLLSGLAGGFPTSNTYFWSFLSIPTWAAIGDMNGDFNNDIVVAVSGSNTIAVFINDGFGNFNPSPVTYPIAGIDPRSIALEDINNDFKLDVIVANFGSKDINVLLNTASGTLGLQ
jgi:hypothetical protein